MKQKILLQLLALIILSPGFSIAQDGWVSIGPANIATFSFAVADPNIFVGANCGQGGVFLSTDNGDHWTQMNTGLPTGAIEVISMAYDDQKIYAGMEIDGGVFVSSDNGAHWEEMGDHQASYLSLVPAGEPWNTVISGTSDGVFALDDDNNWIRLGDVLPVNVVFPVAVQGNDIYAGTDQGVYKLKFLSFTWEKMSTGMPNGTVIFCLAINGTNIFAGSSAGGIFLSTDQGNQWTPVNTGLNITNCGFSSFVLYDSAIFVGAIGENAGVYKSIDNGDHWIEVSTGIPDNTPVFRLAVMGDYMYAATVPNGVFRRALSELTDTKEIEISEQYLSIDPNPNHGIFTVSLASDKMKNIKLSCYNLYGEVILSKECTLMNGELKEELNLSTVANGMYIVQIEDQGELLFRKIVIDQ